MYRETNDRDPLSFDEVVLIRKNQKFRVGFMLIWYTSSIFATYISRMMDANNFKKKTVSFGGKTSSAIFYSIKLNKPLWEYNCTQQDPKTKSQKLPFFKMTSMVCAHGGLKNFKMLIRLQIAYYLFKFEVA